MPLARIRTHFPEEVAELCDALIQAGYTVETVRPDEFHISPADLELSVDKLPVVDAWRNLPNADVIYVANGTPESVDIQSAIGNTISYEPWLARVVVNLGEAYLALTHWTAKQARGLRAWSQHARQRWTPPREYQSSVHLEPAAPSSLDHSAEPKIDVAIGQALLRQQELRRREEAERKELAERARQTEESRRRAREAAEAKALLEEQQKIEAMVRATAELRRRMVEQNTQSPAPRVTKRRRPRSLLRTRRDRAFFRAGIAALALSLGLSLLANQALHPRSASSALPESAAAAPAVPFQKPVPLAPVAAAPQNAEPPSPTPAFAAEEPMGAASPENTTASLKPVGGKSTNSGRDSIIADDEVIVRKPMVSRSNPSKKKAAIAHYSDLD